MSVFDLAASVRNAQRRLGATLPPPGRRLRSDRGRSRLDPRVLSWLAAELGTQDRPAMGAVLGRVASRCRRAGLRPPSRSTIYKLLDALPTRTYRFEDLPLAAREALYNLDSSSEVPGHQLAFYCFNYGSVAAVSFAAALPWLALRQALGMPGWRGRSRGLAEAVAQARGL